VTAPTPPATENTQDAQDFQTAYDLLNKDDIAGAQRLAAAIRKRSPKFPMLATLTSAITTRESDIKKREEQIAEQTRIAAALEEEKKKTAAAQKDAEEAKANAAPVLSVAPGGAFIANSAPPTPALLGEVERPAIEKLVQQWAGALGTLDVATISKIRSFTEAEAKSWQNVVKNYKSLKVNAKVTDMPEVVGDQARVKVQEIWITTQKNGIDITQAPRENVYRMHKVGGEWRMLLPSTPMPTP